MKCIGVKLVDLKEMSWAEFQTLAAETQRPKRPDDAPGYHIRYEDGYCSWSPQAVADAAYRSCDAMTFGLALEAIKQGHKVARRGWNGANMFIVFMSGMQLPPYNTQGTERKVNDRTAKWIGKDQALNCQPYIAMYNAQKQWIPGWVASQSDMLSDDWYLVESELA